MKKLVKLLPLVAALTLVSCKKDQTAEQLVVEENVEATTATTTPAPEAVAVAAAAGPATTVALSESNFAFGKIKKGEKVEHVYEVTNTGTNPLVISEVKPACGCTVPDYTKDPILPGQKGKITLKFDSASFDGLVSKQAEVYANVEKAPIVLSFSADIQP
ncbi:MAG: DUF1573 domain-containing protein [Kaistella sp.]